MKWTFCIKRSNAEQKGGEVERMAITLLKGGIVHWGKLSEVKAFTEPLHPDGTPATELGYINMLVEGPVISLSSIVSEVKLNQKINEAVQKALANANKDK